MDKHKLFLFIAFILAFTAAQAQEIKKEANLRKKYINLSFANTKMAPDGLPKLESNYGAAFTVGRTFYLHKKPLAGIIRIGIDATWFDLNYTNYKIKHITDWDTDNYDYHQADISMHIGPSITVNPIGKLNVHGYFRYAPSFSALYIDDNFYGNYASLFVGGVSVSYGVIGLGIESRFGNCDYREMGSDDEDEALGKLKTTLSGWRTYLTFRF